MIQKWKKIPEMPVGETRKALMVRCHKKQENIKIKGDPPSLVDQLDEGEPGILLDGVLPLLQAYTNIFMFRTTKHYLLGIHALSVKNS